MHRCYRILQLDARLSRAVCRTLSARNVVARLANPKAKAAADGIAPAGARQTHSRTEIPGLKAQQSLDYTSLSACATELKSGWVPAKVEEVVQPDKFTLVLRLRTPLQQGWLHLSWHPVAARVCIGDGPLRGAASEAFSFAEQAASELVGLVLIGVEMPAAWERVLALAFGRRPGEPAQRRLLCEVMGRYSNVIMADEADRVLVCAHQVGEKMSSLRLVQQGRTYQLPPVTYGIPPSLDHDMQVWRTNVTGAANIAATSRGAGTGPTLLEGCVRAYHGVSPLLVEELCMQAGVQHSAAPSQLADADWSALFARWREWLQRLASGTFAASMDEEGRRYSVLGSLPRQYDSVHAMLGMYYGELQRGEQHAALHQRLTSAVATALKRARGKVFSFEKQLHGSTDADAVQRQADLLTANLYRLEPGMAEAVMEDWDSGREVRIVLDPLVHPKETAAVLYRRARKLRRAVDAVAPLLESARSELVYLEEVAEGLQQLANPGDVGDLRALSEVQDELVEAGVIRAAPEASLAARGAAKGRKAVKKASKGGGKDALLNFRKFTTPSGLQVLVGRSNTQNDELTHRVAAPNDLWMHVRGMPGSHTLLRVPSGKQADDSDILFAADLAAFFSKGRTEGKAEVIVAKPADLKKPKGAKPGQVLVTKERVVVARPSRSAAAQGADVD